MKYLPASSQLRQDAIRDAKNARMRQRAVHVHRAALNKVLRTLRSVSPDGARVFAYGGTLPEVLFKLDIYDLESFKDKKLIRALERIERASGAAFGYTWDNKYTTNPSREIRARTKLNNPYIQIELVVTAVIADNSPGCKRVKVGERVSVEPVYEIQCV